MKIIGAGLARTGTTSLFRALELLGYRSLKFDTKRLEGAISGSEKSPNFNVFDDVDAVIDVPTAIFFEELSYAYPAAKVILTIRDEDQWWRSYCDLSKRVRHAEENDSSVRTMAENIRNIAYGSPSPKEFIYRKKFREHNKRVVDNVPPEKLLVIDITAGDGWELLCPFLGVRTPSDNFPDLNKTSYQRSN